MKAIVWSKDDCPYCVQAKNLLQLKGIQYEERNITQGTWTKKQILVSVPTARAVPQILIDDILVGGFAELRKLLG